MLPVEIYAWLLVYMVYVKTVMSFLACYVFIQIYTDIYITDYNVATDILMEERQRIFALPKNLSFSHGTLAKQGDRWGPLKIGEVLLTKLRPGGQLCTPNSPDQKY